MWRSQRCAPVARVKANAKVLMGARRRKDCRDSNSHRRLERGGMKMRTRLEQAGASASNADGERVCGLASVRPEAMRPGVRRRGAWRYAGAARTECGAWRLRWVLDLSRAYFARKT